MIKRALKQRKVNVQPNIYQISDHDINLNLIDHDALYVMNKLREAGFIAYLVGGSVRDLLLKRVPKDFDISTSARPEQIKHLFHRNCILIGRRFLLAHVRFGHKVIEVSTFRSGDEEDQLILKDNQWGTPEQDVMRRDFTINGLFYDSATHSIIDYVNGWEDIHKNILRPIGNSEVRFRQDPVRMLRLLKFRARFGFKIIPEARAALINCRQEILKSSPARILEEMLRMLESGAAAPFFSLLNESGLLEPLFPMLSGFIKSSLGQELFLYLTSADKLNHSTAKKSLERPILISCLLFSLLEERLKKEYLDQNRIPHMGEVILMTTALLKEFEDSSFVHFPRRLMAIVHTILTTQFRLTPLAPKRHHNPRVMRNKDFRSSLIFFKIRALVHKNLIDPYHNWKSLYLQSKRHVEHHVS